MYAFERFTERAKRTLALAQQEAERSGHSYIGTEHLLLGLLSDEDSLSYHALTNLGVETPAVRKSIEGVLGRDERIVIQQIVPTSRVKKVIEISFEEARRMGHNYVGTEHLLLGLMIEGEGIAAHVLQDLGVTLERVRSEIARLLTVGHSAEQAPFVRPGMTQVAGAAELTLGPDLADLLRFASVLARAEGQAAVGLEHVQRATGDPTVQSLLQLAAQSRLAAAAKEEAIARQDHEAAAERRQEERRLREEFAKAEAAWRASIEKPPAK
jgi:ATP-dependent Clp protease ATP-binding subunit ClpA